MGKYQQTKHIVTFRKIEHSKKWEILMFNKQVFNLHISNNTPEHQQAKFNESVFVLKVKYKIIYEKKIASQLQ